MFFSMDKSGASKGFSLIEAMVATAVLGFGLMAIATFHTKLVSGSGENKARLEALALAEEKIEEFRAETNQDNFEDLLVSDFDPSNPIDGVNAEFSRSWEVEQPGNYFNVEVTVAWEDRAGEADSVTLNSVLTFEDPTLAAAAAEQERTSAIASPTGKAVLGGIEFDGEVEATNPDGMKEAFDENDRLLLRDNDENDGYDVVLTLQEACNVDGVCSDFVKINGTIYFDDGLKNNFSYDEVFVIASDAAYCNRYVKDGDSAYLLDDYLEDNSNRLPERNGHKYFNYTCYLGGGWSGNIGVISPDPIDACMGDPSYADNSPYGPQRATRRVYRGMKYLKDENGNMAVDPDTNVGIYRTVGIKDGAVLPASDDEPPIYPGHDFMVADLGGNKICRGALTKKDASLFTGVPGAFVCLNPDNLAFNEDSEDWSLYGVEDSCPFNPATPASNKYTLTATVSIEGVSDQTKLANFRLRTSAMTWEQALTRDQADSVESGPMEFTLPYYTTTEITGNKNNQTFQEVGWDGSVEVGFRDENGEPVDVDVSCTPEPDNSINFPDGPFDWIGDKAVSFVCNDDPQESN
ncbi:prepilin-type N-terminal cleavage/methylation domain-containing protein [Marinobacter sp. G11]|uniref:type IV pilus modification PilV family protein n=1 Tax=Marinobacter sp. G11 TaxID=2903522 RepID=UPI001E5DFA5B|nr:prepilin-type N-terminal cleavage/methylation domain-containing protein [Marinobacter sp. G11]MCE0758777.1 prepilin-type N-terminal cleavage/methylation domain-containing protein [Marinobacter sp. G11]